MSKLTTHLHPQLGNKNPFSGYLNTGFAPLCERGKERKLKLDVMLVH
uniref:Uncharacterized protein n=1 Tax=Arundo donax TaxID=35708 RepID=A0A0A8YQ59_ARUDO